MEQTLGKRIAENRKHLKLTQEQLAEKLGVTAQAVSKWENDQSCPDIGTLPRLAQIFGISTDKLLGCETEKVHTAQVVDDEDDENEGFHIHTDKGEISFNSGRHTTIQLAILVILSGLIYLFSHLLNLDISFWRILWPSALVVCGLFGVFRKFSMIALGAALVGGYFLAKQFVPGGLNFSSSVIFAVIVVLFGFGLLFDAFKKKHKPIVSFRAKHNAGDQTNRNSFVQQEDSFTYDTAFGEDTQHITMPQLRSGEIHCSFGEYRVDFSNLDAVSDSCHLEAHCNFGELTLLIPSRFMVVSHTATVFASIDIIGKADARPEGEIILDAYANFGHIIIEYI